MFTWICPQCGREVPPAYTECPDCAAKASAGATPPRDQPPRRSRPRRLYQQPVYQQPPYQPQLSAAPVSADGLSAAASRAIPAAISTASNIRRNILLRIRRNTSSRRYQAPPPAYNPPPPPPAAFHDARAERARVPNRSRCPKRPRHRRSFAAPSRAGTDEGGHADVAAGGAVYRRLHVVIMRGLLAVRIASASTKTPSATVENPAAKPGANANPWQKYIEIIGRALHGRPEAQG